MPKIFEIVAAWIFQILAKINPFKPTPSPPPTFWWTRTPLPVPRRLAGAAPADGKILLFGGEEIVKYVGETRHTKAAEAVMQYDPVQNAWTEIGQLPTPRSTCAVLKRDDGTILVAGGLERRGGTWARSEKIEIYDPHGGDWLAGGAFEAHRFCGTALSGDRYLYGIGGMVDASNGEMFSAEVFRHDLDTGENSGPGTIAPMPTPRMWLSAVCGKDGLIYAIGGLNLDGSLTVVEAYDPVADAWQTRAPMLVPRREFATVVGPTGHIYALGGMTNGPLGATDDKSCAFVEKYDPVTDSWENLPELPSGVMDHAAAIDAQGRIFVTAGQSIEYCGADSVFLDLTVATAVPVTH